MKPDKRLAIEALSTAGVIASLLFVGIQVKQGAEATRAATVLELKNGWLQFNLAQADNPDIVGGWARTRAEGWDSIDLPTRWQVGAMYRSFAHNWSNAYYQYRLGTLEEEHWEAVVRDIEGEAEAGDLLWDFWDDWNHVYDDSFRTYMDSVRSARRLSR